MPRVAIPFPLSSSPGGNPQESAGRLVNCYAEPLGEGAQSKFVWRASSGLSQLAASANSGYRGGLLVNNLAYETWSGNASTVNSAGVVTSIGTFPGTKKVSIARNQAEPTPDVVAVDLDNGAYVLGSATVAAAVATITIGGTSFVSGDIVDLVILNYQLDGFPVTVSHTLGASETASTVASALNTLINANSVLSAANVSSTVLGAVITLSHQGAVGNNTNLGYGTTALGNTTTMSSSVTGTGNESVLFSPFTGGLTATAGAATATANVTIGGSSFVSGDTVALSFFNSALSSFPVTVSHTLGGSESASTIASALKTLINAQSTLAAALITATVAAGVITISQSIGNETVIFNPTTGYLTGGTGTHGAFVGGIPTSYNGLGNLPAPNSICFQDGYFFFTTGANQVYATGINNLTLNALTYITVAAKADVNLLRAVAFSGFLFLFTTGSCEVWQDAANPAPNFPYARIAVLEFGLIQSAAIDGFETGFSELIWVAQDFGVHWMTAGGLSQLKISPPDLDRLIEAEVRAGNTLEAGCYIVAGKKFWHLSSPDWTWEFNLQTKKWTERWSLNSSGIYGRWRATGGHPAFGKWLVGDEQSGNILWQDGANFTENGAVLLFRIESGPVSDFPDQVHIARADFNMDFGVGIAVGSFAMAVTGAASGTGGVVRLGVNSTSQAKTNDVCTVSGVTGTTEANGTYPITVIDATHIELQGTAFANAYTSGGAAIDLTSPPNAVDPVVAISLSKDGGLTWGNPLVRALGPQGNVYRQRVSVKHMGLSSTAGDRWRLDISDPVYRGFMNATQSSDARDVGV